MEEYRVAFVGAGGIARAHAFAIAALPYYYDETPVINRSVVTSAGQDSRNRFATQYEFSEAVKPEAIWKKTDINTVFILGPNACHYPHLASVLDNKGVHHIYIEKPICVSEDEEKHISKVIERLPEKMYIQAGFQFLQMPNVRRALRLWKETNFGTPIHFHARYLHSGYLNPDYRNRRSNRLKPAPAGGAIADLGSHTFSFLAAFLGEHLKVVAAEQSGAFDDVPAASDLCTSVLLRDEKSGASGTVVASRISAGAGDELELEIRCEKCSLRLSTLRPDVLEVFQNDSPGEWRTIRCGSDYLPITKFPSQPAPSGWLRSLIHAHYLFFGGTDGYAFIPDLRHGLTVQRLVRQTAEHLSESKKKK